MDTVSKHCDRNEWHFCWALLHLDVGTLLWVLAVYCMFGKKVSWICSSSTEPSILFVCHAASWVNCIFLIQFKLVLETYSDWRHGKKLQFWAHHGVRYSIKQYQYVYQHAKLGNLARFVEWQICWTFGEWVLDIVGVYLVNSGTGTPWTFTCC